MIQGLRQAFWSIFEQNLKSANINTPKPLPETTSPPSDKLQTHT